MQFTMPDYVILIVADLERTVHFYTDVLGLSLAHRAGDYAQYATGATRLGFYTRDAMAKTLGMPLETPAAHAPGFELGFKVDHVDAVFTELVKRGAAPVTPPVTRPWGQRTAYLSDPDGYLIELVQPLERPTPAATDP